MQFTNNAFSPLSSSALSTSALSPLVSSRRRIPTVIILFSSVIASLLASIATSHHVAAGGIDFEDLTLDSNSHFDGYGAGATAGGSWQSGGASFNTNPFGPGWSYSNINDTTTAGFTNSFAAITGSGSGIYAMATAFAPNEAIINLFAPTLLADVQVTNSTYAALSMRDGDAFAKKFGGDSGDDPDFFMVTFTGYSDTNKAGSETGSASFYLADYRFVDNSLDYIIDQWTAVDLTGLGNAHSIAVTFSGSDVGGFGLNTPAYVAIDNIRFAAIPEPSGAILLVIGVTVTLRRRKTKVKCRRETRQIARRKRAAIRNR